MSFIPRVHEVYKHFKGDLYQITAIAEHTETGEQLVVYQAMYGEFKIYARPLNMFISRVDKVKYPDVTQEFRFELQGPEAERQRRECAVADTETEVDAEVKVDAETNADAEVKDDAEIKVESEVEADVEALDPMLIAFLDSDSYVQKLNILAALQHRITDEMITTMAIACDVEIEDGDIERRFESLKGCLMTLEKYECNRMR